MDSLTGRVIGQLPSSYELCGAPMPVASAAQVKSDNPAMRSTTAVRWQAEKRFTKRAEGARYPPEIREANARRQRCA